jgi:hypothetical protein
MTRRVWVAEVPEDDEWSIGPCEVMIEQFDDEAPRVAFRRKAGWATGAWGRPFQSKGEDDG